MVKPLLYVVYNVLWFSHNEKDKCVTCVNPDILLVSSNDIIWQTYSTFFNNIRFTLGLALAHVAVITLSEAAIVGYNPIFFNRYLLLLVFIYYLLLS